MEDGPHLWWCSRCDREVSPQFVTYQETHDGCGAEVSLVPGESEYD